MLPALLSHLQTILAGGAAGALHVLTGPDHLAAIAPLAVRSPARAVVTGASWGFGHAAGVLALGALGTLARSFIHVSALSQWAEMIVGGVLLVVGAWGFWQARSVAHAHEHEHPSSSGIPSLRHTHAHKAAFGVGMIHGAAGTGHLFGVLPSLALPVPQAISYLLAYGLTAIVAMAGFGLALGLIGHRLRPAALLWLLRGTAGFACVLGLYWIGSSWPS